MNKRFKMMALIVGIVLVVVVVGLQLGGRDYVPAQASGLSYKNPRKHFALEAPADWERLENAPGYSVMLLGPRSPNEPQATVDVMVLPASGIPDMEEYLAMCRKAVSAFQDYKELQAKVVKHAGGLQAALIECEHAKFGPTVRMKQYSILCGGKQFIITASVPVGSADKLMPQMDKILDSFYVW